MEEVVLPTETKVLYIGAGLDLSPVQYLSHIKEFVFVDSLPRTSSNSEDLFTVESAGFIDTFKSHALSLGFVLVSEKELIKHIQSKFTMTQSLYYKFNKNKVSKYINPTLLQFANTKTGQIIKYYASTKYPDNLSEELVSDIKSSDSFVINGFDYPKTILELLPKSITLFAWAGNKYTWGKNDLDGSETDSLTYYLGSLNKSELSLYIKKIVKVGKSGSLIIVNNWSGL